MRERRTKLDFPVEGSPLCIFLSPGKKIIPSQPGIVREGEMQRSPCLSIVNFTSNCNFMV